VYGSAKQESRAISQCFVRWSPLHSRNRVPNRSTRRITNRNEQTISSPSVHFTWPLVYNFFGAASGSNVIDKEGKPSNWNFEDADTWIKNRLSYFSTHEASTEHREHLQKALHQSVTFRRKLAPTMPSEAYPPIINLASKKHPTPLCMIIDGPKSVRGYDFETAPKAHGDVRVPWEKAQPPAGVPYESVETDFEHSQLLDDPKVRELLSNLCAASSKRFGS